MFALHLFQPAAAGLRTFTTASSRSPVLFRQTYRKSSGALCQHVAARGWQQRAFAQSTRKSQYRRQVFNYQTFLATLALLKRWAARPTFYYEVGGLTAACGAFYVANLEPVPISGRYRFRVVPYSWEASEGRQMYAQTMEEYGSKIMPASSREHRLVQRVLDRLVPHSGLQDEEWEIHVIDDPMKNAFVIPGGKVFVFRGIMDIAEGEDGMAAVLGHEIAHNIAHHAAERMSGSYILVNLAMVASIPLGLDPSFGSVAVNLAFTLPGSRQQEAEADYIGLLMMSESCYDPTAAMRLWAAMEEQDEGAPPQFLSTHPSNHNRLEKIREWLPEAEDKRAQSGCASTIGYADDFRRQVGGLSRF
ncbi:hypothetical protein LTR36_001763 [Oleoguttula mirabilis]|uniref:Peptidase M48 domain-containing protein n=1 Tax=Oleoguttula mirabilis TaxID=1507867 RepID=A0AAV9JMI2_9PEZI|nr:hypothetical protein LTR36_001763 [Oleoguttula mirabilis]